MFGWLLLVVLIGKKWTKLDLPIVVQNVEFFQLVDIGVTLLVMFFTNSKNQEQLVHLFLNISLRLL